MLLTCLMGNINSRTCAHTLYFCLLRLEQSSKCSSFLHVHHLKARRRYKIHFTNVFYQYCDSSLSFHRSEIRKVNDYSFYLFPSCQWGHWLTAKCPHLQTVVGLNIKMLSPPLVFCCYFVILFFKDGKSWTIRLFYQQANTKNFQWRPLTES